MCHKYVQSLCGKNFHSHYNLQFECQSEITIKTKSILNRSDISCKFCEMESNQRVYSSKEVPTMYQATKQCQWLIEMFTWYMLMTKSYMICANLSLQSFEFSLGFLCQRFIYHNRAWQQWISSFLSAFLLRAILPLTIGCCFFFFLIHLHCRDQVSHTNSSTPK